MTSGATRLVCPLRAAALATPDVPAVAGPGGTCTYAELDLGVSAAAETLETLVFGAGTRVALHLPKD